MLFQLFFVYLQKKNNNFDEAHTLADKKPNTMGKGKNAPLYIHVLSDTVPSSVTLPIKSKIKNAVNLENGNKIKYQRNGKAGTISFMTDRQDNDNTDYIIKVEF